MNVCLKVMIRKCFCFVYCVRALYTKLFFPLSPPAATFSCLLLHPKFNRKLLFIFKSYVFKTYL